MQVQKPETKQKIIDAALTEFAANGLKNASMRRIADAAEITVGNIYSYFGSKTELFDSLLADTEAKLLSLININLDTKNMSMPENMERIARLITEAYTANRRQFEIIMHRAEGSKYEKIKEWVVEFVSIRLQEFMPQYNLPDARSSAILTHCLARAILEGFISITGSYSSGNDEQVFATFKTYIEIILSSIYAKDTPPLSQEKFIV